MRKQSSQSGFTIVELLVAVSLMSILTGIAISNLRSQADPLSIATSTMEGFIKQMRARAISTTRAYTIYASSAGRVEAKYSNKCSDTTKTVDTRYFLKLPTSVTLTTTNWNVCYSSRGFPDQVVDFQLTDTTNNRRTLQVMLGGTVRFS